MEIGRITNIINPPNKKEEPNAPVKKSEIKKADVKNSGEFLEACGRAQVQGINISFKGLNVQRKDYTQDFTDAVNKNELYKEIFDNAVEEGFDEKTARQIASTCEDEGNLELFLSLKGGEFCKELQKELNNKMLNPYIKEMFDIDNMHPMLLKQIIQCGETKEKLLELSKVFFKSPFKLAMKTPMQYLDGIPTAHTTKVEGKYPPIDNKTKEGYEQEVFDFFKRNLGESLKLLKYTDADTYNQLMDKRLEDFQDFLLYFDTLKEENLELLKKAVNCKQKDGKPLTARDKISLANIILNFQHAGINSKDFREMAEGGIYNRDRLNKIIMEEGLKINGVTEEERESTKEDMLDFDPIYAHEMLQAPGEDTFRDLLVNFIFPARKGDVTLDDEIQEAEDFINGKSNHYRDMSIEETKVMLDILRNYDKYEIDEIKERFLPIINKSETTERGTVIKAAIKGDFSDYTENLEINKETKKEFEAEGLDYQKWRFVRPEKEIEINGRKLKLNIWKRRPQQDLFTGNHSSCCTALNSANGDAMPKYLLNTAFNIIQLTDENDNIIGMGRIFAGKEDNSPSIIIDSIELNSEFKKHLKEKDLKDLRDSFFQYAKDFGRTISNKELEVYFSTSYTKVPTEDLQKEERQTGFIGRFEGTNYINCLKKWVDCAELKKAKTDFYHV